MDQEKLFFKKTFGDNRHKSGGRVSFLLVTVLSTATLLKTIYTYVEYLNDCGTKSSVEWLKIYRSFPALVAVVHMF